MAAVCPEGSRSCGTVFSDFTNSSDLKPVYEAQSEAMDEHMEKYDLQDQDWLPEMFELMEKEQS